MELNEHTDLSTLAVHLKKKVNGLLGVYLLMILLTIVLYVVIVAAIGLMGYVMITEEAKDKTWRALVREVLLAEE